MNEIAVESHQRNQTCEHATAELMCVKSELRQVNSQLSDAQQVLAGKVSNEAGVVSTNIYYPAPVGGWGIVFRRFLCLFVCLFISLSATLRENGWTDLHEIFREGVDFGVTMGRPDYILGQFG